MQYDIKNLQLDKYLYSMRNNEKNIENRMME